MAELTAARRSYDKADWPTAEDAYRRVLEADPQNGEALHRLGVLALRRKDPATAAQWLQKAVSLPNGDAKLYNILGVARAEMKQFEEAVACFRKASELEPGWADAHYNCGNALSSLVRLDEAVAAFRTAAIHLPASPEIHYNLANALRDLGRLNDSVAAYRQALRLKPEHLKALNNLGNVLREQGKLAEATETYRAALAIKPGYAQAHYNLGMTLAAQERPDQAIAEFREALRFDPEHAAARANLGKALADLGQIDEAMQILESARSQGHDNVETQLQLADQLRRAGRFDEAAVRIQAVIEARADFAAAHNNMGLVWFGKQDYPKAIESYRQALQIKPDFAEARNNLAIALMIAGDLEAGLAEVEAALRIKPDFTVAHLNRAVAWLQAGRFEAGWHEFEWRRLCENYRVPALQAPRWDGGASPDRCLLLQSEQGIGDTIQFLRYAPHVKRRCGSVILQCQPGLAPLLARCPGIDRVIVRGESLPDYHVQVPLMSLPGILATTLETVPANVPYLFADADLTQTWRERLADHAGFKVGIAWQGNRKYFADSMRSIPLRHYAPLAGVAGVRLFSLQKGPGEEQLTLAADWPVVNFGSDFDAKGGTFMDSAAVMQNLDLVVTSDSAVAHLAGALGVPVWVALCRSCDWRWLTEREDSPWYPTMRLFRQRHLGDWDELFQRIAAELSAVVAGGAARLRPAAASPATPVPGRNAPIRAPITPGELLDKITILETKRTRVTQKEKLPNIIRELAELQLVREQTIPPTRELAAMSDELQAVNEELWEIEDAIRLCEAGQNFGPRFIELARSVYRTNDRRSAIKRKINQQLGSVLLEEKQYAPYDAVPIAPAPEAKSGMPVFYLNLGRRKDRNDQFLGVNAGITGLELRRWEAVDGQLLKNEDLLRSGAIEAPLVKYTQGALGAALSHKAAWDYCVAQKTPVTLCEDDAVFNRNFPQKASDVLSRLPADWDIILWGWNFNSVLEVDVIDGLKRSVTTFDPAKLFRRAAEFQRKCYDVVPLRLVTAFGIVCYSLSPKGAGALLAQCFPLRNESIAVPALGRQLVNFGIDVLMNKYYGSLKAYACYPPLVWTENDKSTSDIGDPVIRPVS